MFNLEDNVNNLPKTFFNRFIRSQNQNQTKSDFNQAFFWFSLVFEVRTIGLGNKIIRINISVGFGSQDRQLTFFSKFEKNRFIRCPHRINLF